MDNILHIHPKEYFSWEFSIDIYIEIQCNLLVGYTSSPKFWATEKVASLTDAHPVFLFIKGTGTTRVNLQTCCDVLIHCLSAANHLCMSVWPLSILAFSFPQCPLSWNETLQFPASALNRGTNANLDFNGRRTLRNTFPDVWWAQFWFLDEPM
jgi:hypothetical protein